MPALERLLPAVGDVLLGRYELREELNRGAFGLVMTARHQGLDELVTVKILMPHVLTNEDMVKRFEREVLLAKMLRHPNTIRILDVGRTADGVPFYVMEHVPGRSLRDLLKAEGCLSPERTRRIAIQVLRSLSEAHARGVVHRDLKPGNLLLCDIHGAQDFVKVLDFGVAKATQTSAGDEAVTHTGVAVGTPAYMSPEQARGANDVDGRSDLYSVGLILTECLTGRRALDVRTLYEAVTLHSKRSTPPVAPALKECPLLPVILKATRHLRERRYATADDMCAALEDLRSLSVRPLAGVQPPAGRERQDTPMTLPATPIPISVHGLLPPLTVVTSAERTEPGLPLPILPPTRSRRPAPVGLWLALAVVVMAAAVIGPILMGSESSRIGPIATPSAAAGEGVAERGPTELKRALGRGWAQAVPADGRKLEEVVGAAYQAVAAAVPPLVPLRLEGTAGAEVSADGRPLGELPLVIEHPRLPATVELTAERRGYQAARFALALDGEGAVVELARSRAHTGNREERREGRPRSEESSADREALPFGRMQAFPAPQGP